ncbi:ROK family protein [Granulicella sibirica]|nr:ROK family protein [Granulicella sibirica]
MIRFKAERGCVLAVDIAGRSLSFLLVDLNGCELEHAEISLQGKKTTPEAICDFIHAEARRLLRLQKKAKERLITIVVGVPAITNVCEGMVLSISTLEQWRSVPLRTMLHKAMGCSVIIENDTNLAAQGERFRGAARAEQNFILVSIGNGIGAGIVLNGEIHHGTQWSAGEIGYLRLPFVSRRNPTLHQFGELETVLTAPERLEGSKGTTGTHAEEQEVEVVGILDLAQAGDPWARRIIAKRAGMVSDIVINLSLILNPGLILFNGKIGSHPYLIESVRKQLERGEFAVTKIGAAALGDAAVLWGGVAVALEAIPSLLLPQPEI